METYTFERISSIRIPIEYKNHEFYSRIKEYLTRRSKQYNSDVFVINKFFIESDKFLHVPRYFPIHDFVKCNIVDKQNHGLDIEIECNITPRNDLQINAISYMLENNKALMELQPGTGKTVISIKVISELKKKTLILVHRDSLAEQWKERIHSFTDLKDEDVVCLRSKSFKKDLEKPIIISTVQTFISLIKRKYSDFVKALYSADIGVCVSDEVHTSVGAPTFSQCSLYIPSARFYGLSATPDRADGNADILQYHLGPIFKDEDINGTMVPRITVILLDYKIDILKKKRYLYWDGLFQKSRYLNMMLKSESFMSISKAILNKVYLENKDIIFVTERIKMIDELMGWNKIPETDKSAFIAGVGNDVLKTKVVLSTPGKIRDGVDCAWKNCLIMTSPISNISQIVGRVIRTYKDKETPIVLDMCDIGCKPISRTLFKRVDFYEERGWEVKFLYIDDDYNKTFIDKNEAFKKIG